MSAMQREWREDTEGHTSQKIWQYTVRKVPRKDRSGTHVNFPAFVAKQMASQKCTQAKQPIKRPARNRTGSDRGAVNGLDRHGLGDCHVRVGAVDGGKATRHEELLHGRAVVDGDHAGLELGDRLLKAWRGRDARGETDRNAHDRTHWRLKRDMMVGMGNEHQETRREFLLSIWKIDRPIQHTRGSIAQNNLASKSGGSR
jgi:hypothetical protein